MIPCFLLYLICYEIIELNKIYTTQEYFLLEESGEKIENENQYYYPDIFITKEPERDENRYVQFEPELIIEVVSETTRTKDMVDKFIQYRKISTLKYYLVVEPQKFLVLCNSKDEKGNWDTTSYTKENEIIQLSLLNVTLPLEKIYNS